MCPCAPFPIPYSPLAPPPPALAPSIPQQTTPLPYSPPSPPRTMHPKAQLVPKRLGVQGKVKKTKASSSKRLSSEELKEMRKLANILPPVSRPSDPDSEETLRKAAAYIQQLVATVHARVANGTLPSEVLSTLPPQHAVLPRRCPQKPSIEKKR